MTFDLCMSYKKNKQLYWCPLYKIVYYTILKEHKITHHYNTFVSQVNVQTTEHRTTLTSTLTFTKLIST